MFPNLADLPRNWHIKKYKNGISYCGELRDKVWHGYGRLRLADDEIYEGEWENGKRCGIGVYTYHDRTIYYGQWRSNVKEGFGVLVRSDGHVYEGTWRDNKPDGFGRYTYANGDVYVGDMLDGMQNGSGLYISVDGSRYLGSWRDGRRQGEGLCRLPDGSFYAGGWDDDAMTAGSLRLPNGRVQQVMWDSDAGEWRIVGEQRDRSTASAAIIFSDSVLDKIRMEASGGLSTEDPQQSEDVGSPRNSNMRSPEVAQLRAHHPQLFVRRSRLDVLRALAVRLPRHVVVAARGDESGERSAGGSGREPTVPVIPTSATGMLAATEGIMSPQTRQQSQWLKGQLTSAFQAGTRWRQRDSEMDSLHPLASPAYLAKQLLIRLRTEMRREDEARGTEGVDVLQNGSHYEAEMRYVCLVSECLQLFFQMLADRVLRATDNAAAVYVLQSLSRRLAKASEREANSAETASYLSNIVKQQHQALTAIVSRLNETAHAEQDVVPISATGIVEETSVRAVLRRIDKLSARPGREREHDALLRDLAPVQPTADVHLRLQRLLAENAKLVSVNDSLRARIVDLELAVTSTVSAEPRDVHPGGGGVGAPEAGRAADGAASMADSAGVPVPSVQPVHAPAVGDTGASLVQAAELQRLQRQVKALSGALENLELQSESRLQGKDEEIAELRKQLRRAIGERDSANAKCEEHAALAVRLAQENNALRDQCVQLQEAARGGKAAAPAAAAANERDGASRGRARSPTKSGTERRSSSVNSRGASPRGSSSQRSTSASSARDASAPRSRSVPRPSTAGGAARSTLAGAAAAAAAAASAASGSSKPFLQRGSGSGGAVARRAPVPNVAFGRSASPPSSIPRKSSLEDVAGAAAGGNRSAVSPPRMPGKARAGSQEAPEQFGSGPATPVDTSPGMRRPVSDSIGGAGAPHSAAAHRHDVRVQRAHGPSSGPAATSVSSPTTPTDSAAAAAGRSHAAGVMSGIEFDDAANMSRSRLTGTPFSQLQLAGTTPYDPVDHEMSSIVSRNTTDTPLMAQWNASDAPGAMMAPPVNIVNRPRRVPSLRLLAEMPLQDDVPDGVLPRTMPPPGHPGARGPTSGAGLQRPPPMPSVSPAPDQGGRAGSFYSVQSGPGSGGGSSTHLQGLVANSERRGSQASRPYDDEHGRRGSDATRDAMAATSMLVAPTSSSGTPARAPSDSPPSISRGTAAAPGAPRPRGHDAHVSTPAARAAPQAPVAFSSSAVAAIRDDAHAFPVHHMHSVGSAPSPAAAPSNADDSQLSSPRYSHFRSFRRASATE